MNMNILAVDFGTKNIGLAWVATGVGVVLPYGIIRNDKGVAEDALAKLIKEEKIDRIIFGLPFGEMINIEIIFESELFTSGQAGRTAGGVSRDEKSAMIILESYLSKNKI